MRKHILHCDVAVVGGGLAGICAAIAAARQGVRVVLVNDRPVLGGNSSSEIRVWVCGATAHGTHQWARETGIMGELFIENQYRNPEGNPYYWDLVILDAVRAEPNIDLWLNTHITDVECDSETREIAAVHGWQMSSETQVSIEAGQFVDATGDGLIGFLAGASFAQGREGAGVYGESWAPEVADRETLGSTILFYAKDAGRPSRFVAPTWALDIADTTILEHRKISPDMNGCDFWWIEWGGDRDIVHDNEAIRDNLQAVAYGIWDHIKNSGSFTGVENQTLEWIGSVPGKREYRRFYGDHILTQTDVLTQQDFPDAVAFGGWSIDLHPPGGVFAAEPGSRHWYSNGPYPIPLRCLYSRDVPNLWMAGRDISASHVAFGSTRVMATCATTGEGAGLGASLVSKTGLTREQLAGERVDVLQRALVRSDASVIGLCNDDPNDVARTATVTASSTRLTISATDVGEPLPIGGGVAMILPQSKGLRRIEFLVDAPKASDLVLTQHRLAKPQDSFPIGEIASWTAAVPAGTGQWIGFDLPEDLPGSGNLFLSLTGSESLTLYLARDRVPGVVAFRHRTLQPNEKWSEQYRQWKGIPTLTPPVMRTAGDTDAYTADHVIGGYARPYGGPQLWSSAPLNEDPTPELTLSWEEPVTIEEVQVILDDDLLTDLINLHHHRTPDEIMPTLIKDYDLQARTDGGWRTLAQVRDNHHRHHRHQLEEPVVTAELRLRVLSVNGFNHAHVVKVRAYKAP
ncbi:MAG: FAD-dependent oxidoreductase [Propionibacteriaceae bacterium]